MKRAQSAIEFLTTYGWMFMIVLMVAGGLVYFDVIDPSNFVSDSCRFDSSLSCGAFASSGVAADDSFIIDIQLTSNLPNDIQINSMDVKIKGADDFCTVEDIHDIGTTTSLSAAERTIRSRGTVGMSFFFEDGVCDFAASGLDILGRQRYEMRIEYVLAAETNQFPQIVPGVLIIESQRT